MRIACQHSVDQRPVDVRHSAVLYNAGMTPEQAISHWTNQATLAKALGVSPQTVNNWLKRKHIPLRWQVELQDLTLGALRIDRGNGRGRRA
jgi:hypothetical protein